MGTRVITTPRECAKSALARAIADDLWATSTTGDVYDVTVKYDFESWRDCAERIGTLAAEHTGAALTAATGALDIPAILGEHWNWDFPRGIPTCMCGARLDFDGWEPGNAVYPALHRHQAALITAALLDAEVAS